MSQSHRISFALGGATFCLVFPGMVALLFCIGKRFRNARSCTKVILWTTVVLLLAAFANFAQRSAGQRSSRLNSPTGSTEPSPAAISLTNAPMTPDAATTKFVQGFPALYWYASDACLRETTRHGFGHPQKFDEFVKSYTANIEKFEPVESRSVRRYALRLRLHDAENENSGEYWVLEFTGEGNKWEPRSGYKYMNGKRVFDLFEDEYVVGVKAMGSMKPYFEKALAAYSAGKDLGTVFKKSSGVAGDSNGFRAYERLNLLTWTPTVRTNIAGRPVKCLGPVLDPAKAAIVTNGISLGDLVTNLGPGWMSPASRANSIEWDFADGRFLHVSPPKSFSGENWQASFILSTTNTAFEGHVWWVTNEMFCFTNRSNEK